VIGRLTHYLDGNPGVGYIGAVVMIIVGVAWGLKGEGKAGWVVMALGVVVGVMTAKANGLL
jgi:hypothetical protein